jgi:glycerol-3-phosphate acyltransferase PlsY
MTPTDWLPVLLAMGGYLLGSIPFGVLVTKALGTVDPRTAGSRNIGFTNVLRVAGKPAGLLTLVGDVGKGWVVAAAARQMVQEEAWVLVIALSSILGHLYPVFLGFHGGKGVATALGAITGVDPWMGLGLLAVWLVTMLVGRYSSAAAVAAFLSLPVQGLIGERGWRFELLAVTVAVLILIRHRGNLVRLWQGTEPRMIS